KHGTRARRTWRKLHVATDADTGMIVAATLTENDKGDSSQVEPLLSMVEEEIDSLTADGAYDGAPTYEGRGGDRGRYRGDYSSSSIGSSEPCCRGPPFSARAAYSSERGHRATQMAAVYRPYPTVACRDDDG